jgi:ribosomal protein S12 methylthiotransferase accessory factor YcaO
MPHTEGLLGRASISEWTATLLVRETALLTDEDRRLVDERLCATTFDTATGEVRDPVVLHLTPRRVERTARALACELDAEAAVRRARKAEGIAGSRSVRLPTRWPT